MGHFPFFILLIISDAQKGRILADSVEFTPFFNNDILRAKLLNNFLHDHLFATSSKTSLLLMSRCMLKFVSLKSIFVEGDLLLSTFKIHLSSQTAPAAVHMSTLSYTLGIFVCFDLMG